MSVLDYMRIPQNLGIDSNGISRMTMDSVRGALEGAIEANDNNIKAFASNPIQRRGQNLPGDVGQNFGLYNNNQFDFGGSYNGFREIFNSSNFNNGAGFGLSNNYGQGSNAGFSQSTRLAHHKMASVVSAYKGFGIIKNVVDLMANFAAEGLKIKHPNKSVQKFYKRWAEHVGLQQQANKILRYYYKYSNVFIYTTMGQIDSITYDRMKRAKANSHGDVSGFEKIGKVLGDSNDPNMKKRVEDAEKESKKPLTLREIPWRYQMLNPFQMELMGTEYFGESEWIFVMDPHTATRAARGEIKSREGRIHFLDQTEMNIPPEFKKLASQGKNPRVVKLDQAKLWTLFYMKDDHEDWADPMIWPVMNDIRFKNKLRQMDISVCDSVINSITIFKLGDWKGGFVPPKSHFDKFAEYLRTPTAAMTMVWNDSVDVISNHPPVERILSMQKYESVDRDILRGLGVPDTLIGGATGGNFSTGFLGVRTLLERLEEGRNAVLVWLNDQLRIIAKVMGHRTIPTVKFGKMSLRDEKAEKQLILGLLDRNVISVQAVLEAFDEDFVIELERMREEKKIADDEGIFVKHGPFTDPMALMTDEEVMEHEDERIDKAADIAMKEKQADRKAKINIQRQTKKQGQNGRPGNSGGISQEKKRETKPKGMASFIKGYDTIEQCMADYENQKKYSLAHINSIEKIITAKILVSQNKKYKKSLSKKDRDGIEQISFAIASNIDHNIKMTIDIAQSTLKEYPQMQQRIFEIYSKLLKPQMTYQERKSSMASAIATYDMEED